jgi:methylmalonyl-CoA/ethylmalonyl-CoA epimerase
MIRKIDHVGIAVRALEDSLPFWADALGLEVGGIETVPDEKVKVAFLALGPNRIELLEPTEDGSAVARHLSRRGAGIHHLTLAVDDLPALLARLESRGVEIVGRGPRIGSAGRLVAFLHPRSTGGVLVELAAAGPAPEPSSMLGPGSAILAYLREPSEKLWGVLRRLDETGLVLEGIDLASFEDWVGQIEREERTIVGPSVLFVPTSRLEKILLDRSSGDLPSLAERFARRTGRTVQEVLGVTS